MEQSGVGYFGYESRIAVHAFWRGAIGFSTGAGDIRHSHICSDILKVSSWKIRDFVCRSSAFAASAYFMLYKTLSAAVYGIDANIIQVEVDCSGIKCDQDHFHTVGLPDAAVRESRDRVRAALKNCGYDIPPTQITINLAPADIKKEGSGFDLPMALGIVGAYGGLIKKEIRRLPVCRRALA